MMSINIAASVNAHQCNTVLSCYLGQYQYVPGSGNTNLSTSEHTPVDV